MIITTVDNREAYKKREHKLRFQQPFEASKRDTMSYMKRVALGQRFQFELRVKREVKRRRGLRDV